MKILHVNVAEPVTDMLARAGAVMEALDAGDAPSPYYGIGFDSFPEMLSVFSAERWRLLNTLSANGPSSLSELAARLGREESAVKQDLDLLVDWNVVEPQVDGRLAVPWDEVELHLPLAQRAA
ncbi:hypothetical protein U5801_12445 [Lamprobacter modestohalophilus]|uniref:HVO_A0114 family putative DNA-binding protein n=1 Tax=Lamprobacter modestohalophilus TaxID=1064514 RepID=UPI002ADEBD9A|nr:hypothetical protein [Lamprobacter modestohalophilus]MEA1050609.1 hypothetical protein [Lamprobacter modestohalophilus]